MPLIELTEKAVEYLVAAIAESALPVKGVRFMVQGGGCSGYTYNAILETEAPSETDFIIATYSIEVFIDAMSAPYIRGTTIDYQTHGFTSGLKFINDKQKQCGCGMSFSPGD